MSENTEQDVLDTPANMAIVSSHECVSEDDAHSRRSVSDWATSNARLLLFLVVLLSIPYFFLCWGMAVIVATGGCGG